MRERIRSNVAPRYKFTWLPIEGSCRGKKCETGVYGGTPALGMKNIDHSGEYSNGVTVLPSCWCDGGTPDPPEDPNDPPPNPPDPEVNDPDAFDF